MFSKELSLSLIMEVTRTQILSKDFSKSVIPNALAITKVSAFIEARYFANVFNLCAFSNNRVSEYSFLKLSKSSFCKSVRV